MRRIYLGIACAASLACSSTGVGRGSAVAHAPACAGGRVTSDSELQRYRGCSEVSGDLVLQGVSSLTPLAALRRVEGTLRIERTTRLYTLAGLEHLQSVRALEIHHNQALITAGALGKLARADHASLSNNPRLTTTYGLLEGMSYAGVPVDLSHNCGLTAEGLRESLPPKALAAR
jgi:hypothetical protein